MDRQLIRRFRSFLNDVTDLRDTCGSDPRTRMSNEVLAWWRNHPKEPYQVASNSVGHEVNIYRPSVPTYAAIDSHLSGQRATTIFSASCYRERLLCLADIDNKTGDGDADACANRVIEHLSGEGYVEESTGRKGRHVYFVVSTCGFKCAEVRRRLECLGAKMKSDPFFAQSGCMMDRIMGLPTLWKEVEGRKVVAKRGNVLRLPWLDGLGSVESCLERLIELVPRPLAALRPEDRASKKRLGVGVEATTGSSMRKQAFAESGLRGNEALAKMNEAAWATAVALGRAPTAEEILTHYEAAGLPTGEDHDRNRRQLAEQNEAYLAERVNPGTVGFEARREGLLKAVRATVTEEVRAKVAQRNRTAYSDLQLAVVLHCVETANRKRRHGRHEQTVGLEYVVKSFEGLGIELEGSERTKRVRVSVMRQALEEAKLIRPLEGGSYYGGVAKKYALGINHPTSSR